MNSIVETIYSKKYFDKDYGVQNYWHDYLVQRKFLSEIVKYAKGNSVVDIGCGSANFGRCCKMFGFSYVGMDASDCAVEDCNKHHIQIIKTDFSKPPFPDLGQFYIVTLHGILEHLPLEIDYILLDGIKKYKKDDTIYSFQIPTHHSLSYEKHITLRSYSFWKKTLGRYGYKIIGEYNWSRKGEGLYYLYKLTKWPWLVSQVNVICILK